MGELLELQRGFTRHLRDPAGQPVPAGLDGRRMGIYSSLVFNNVSSLLQQFFPKLAGVLSREGWQRMVRDFFIAHEAQTPYFPALAGEFAAYLETGQLTEGLPPFTAELAHFEALDLALYISEAEPPPKPVPEAQLGDAALALSPLAAPLAYAYPVHKLNADFTPDAPGDTPTLLLMLRDLDETVRTFELQPFAYQLLNDLQQGPGLVPRHWLQTAAKPLADPAARDEFVQKGVDMLRVFNQNRIFTLAEL